MIELYSGKVTKIGLSEQDQGSQVETKYIYIEVLTYMGQPFRPGYTASFCQHIPVDTEIDTGDVVTVYADIRRVA